jgi:arylsulfatase A-like enzyme
MMSGRPDSKSDFYQTLALERMAQRGMVFSNAYACAPTCTPSRAGIQFGKTPCRLRQTVVHDTLAAERGIDCKDETSIAEMIKRANPNFVTGHFGKWGFHPRSPEHAGYDESDGNTNNGEGDYLSVKERTRLPGEDPKRILSVTQRANAFIEKQVAADRPFFMQVSHYAVHAGHSAQLATIDKYRKLPRGAKATSHDYQAPPKNSSILTYAAMIEDLDSGLASLLDKIETLGIEDNTYVIFTSDNGGAFRGNRPLRGMKAQLWEGGIRVPTVVVGPGVKQGTFCDIAIAGWDFYATINDLIGGESLPAEYDGGSLRDVLKRGNAGTIQRGTSELVFHFPWYGGTLPMSAIRDGDYKLVMNLHTKEVQLYNLAEDLGETTDLAAQMPAKTEQLRRRLRAYLEEVDAEDLDDMFDARIRELNRYIQRETERPAPDAMALERHNKALEGVHRARASAEWR